MALPRRRAAFRPMRRKPQRETLRHAKPFRGRRGRGRDRLRNANPQAGPKPGLGPMPTGPGAPKPPPKTPVGQHMTPDAAYYNDVDLAQRQESSRLGELDNQERDIKHEFGIDDPTNPFSRAEGLKRAFLARQKAASAGLAAQGQLYSGAHERALSRTRRDEEQARAELRSAYEGAIGQIGSAKAGVKFATEEERNQAFEDWLARAPEADVDIQEEDDLTTGSGGGANNEGTPTTKIGQLENAPGKQIAPSHVTATAGPPGQREALLKIVRAGRRKGKGKGNRPKARAKAAPRRAVARRAAPPRRREALRPRYRGRR